MIGRPLFCLAVIAAAAACSKTNAGDDKATPAASASAAPTHAASSASVVAPGSAAPAASAKPTAGAGTFAGKYTSAPGVLYIPSNKDWANVKQAKDDPAKGVGEGDITLTVDASGRVAGTIDSGPAAPAIVDGTFADSEIRGTVRRKDPKDEGLTGTLVAKVSGDAAEGKIDLADANAGVVREAKLSLKKK